MKGLNIARHPAAAVAMLLALTPMVSATWEATLIFYKGKMCEGESITLPFDYDSNPDGVCGPKIEEIDYAFYSVWFAQNTGPGQFATCFLGHSCDETIQPLGVGGCASENDPMDKIRIQAPELSGCP